MGSRRPAGADRRAQAAQQASQASSACSDASAAIDAHAMHCLCHGHANPNPNAECTFCGRVCAAPFSAPDAAAWLCAAALRLAYVTSYVRDEDNLLL